MIPNERLVAMFTALDDEGQDVVLDILAGEYERVQRTRRPALRAVGGSQVQGRAKPVPSRTLAPDEAALLKAYRAMPNDAQNDTLCIVEALVEPHMRPRSVLTLVYEGAR